LCHVLRARGEPRQSRSDAAAGRRIARRQNRAAHPPEPGAGGGPRGPVRRGAPDRQSGSPPRSGRSQHGLSEENTVAAQYVAATAKPAAVVGIVGRYFKPRTRIAEGPRRTMKITGRKNNTIGTVSLGGRAAAFFSASDIRMSRFS